MKADFNLIAHALKRGVHNLQMHYYCGLLLIQPDFSSNEKIYLSILLLSVAADPQLQKITYAKSLEDFPYPEGGFYIHLEGKSTHYTALQPDQLKVLRAPRQNGTLSLRLAISLVCGGFLLDSFVHSSISATLL